jgi:acyl-CoA thioester hydrolase
MTNHFSKHILIRWADVDANRHVRHSAYFDYGATVRMLYFSENGLTTDQLGILQIGPILFREEAIFKREIALEDQLIVDVVITKARRDYSRWSLRHTLFKQGDVIAAVINIDGAWMDTGKRKLTVPPPVIQKMFAEYYKPPEFEFSD